MKYILYSIIFWRCKILMNLTNYCQSSKFHSSIKSVHLKSLLKMFPKTVQDICQSFTHQYPIVTGSWKTVPNRTFGISRNTNFNIHGTIFLWYLIVATPDLLQ